MAANYPAPPFGAGAGTVGLAFVASSVMGYFWLLHGMQPDGDRMMAATGVGAAGEVALRAATAAGRRLGLGIRFVLDARQRQRWIAFLESNGQQDQALQEWLRRTQRNRRMGVLTETIYHHKLRERVEDLISDDEGMLKADFLSSSRISAPKRPRAVARERNAKKARKGDTSP